MFRMSNHCVYVEFPVSIVVIFVPNTVVVVSSTKICQFSSSSSFSQKLQLMSLESGPLKPTHLFIIMMKINLFLATAIIIFIIVDTKHCLEHSMLLLSGSRYYACHCLWIKGNFFYRKTTSSCNIVLGAMCKIYYKDLQKLESAWYSVWMLATLTLKWTFGAISPRHLLCNFWSLNPSSGFYCYIYYLLYWFISYYVYCVYVFPVYVYYCAAVLA